MVRLYRWLIRLTPAALRREYGAAMEETFTRRLNDARASGFWMCARVCGHEFTGLIGLLLSERWGVPARLQRQRQRTQSRGKAGRMDTVGREIRHAGRRLVRSPVFTLAAVLTLALAIGANAAIFTVVYRVVLNPLPYPDSDRLIALDYGLPTRNINSGVKYMSSQFYYQLADRARTLDKVAVYNISGVTLTGTEGNPERIQISRATPSLASVLRVQPALGRWFTDEEGVPGSPPPVVLSYGLWVRRYGREPAIVGRSLTIDGLPATVVGVMPASFTFPDARTDAWIAAQSTRKTASSLFTVIGPASKAIAESRQTAVTIVTGSRGSSPISILCSSLTLAKPTARPLATPPAIMMATSLMTSRRIEARSAPRVMRIPNSVWRFVTR
jgi:hypothetical protein